MTIVVLREEKMSCCSKGYCDFKFPEGPPLVDNSIQNLNATYQFLPYGSLLQEGEVVRIWMESGKTKTVILEQKLSLEVLAYGFRVLDDTFEKDLPWQLIAFDSGLDYEDMMHWGTHPLFNAQMLPVVMVYQHPIEPKPTLKDHWLSFLYKMRNLGRS